MTDRVPGAPGQYKAVITGDELQKLQAGEQFTLTLTRDDQPVLEGTPYNKAAVLPDDLAALICPDITDPTPADALEALHTAVKNASGDAGAPGVPVYFKDGKPRPVGNLELDLHGTADQATKLAGGREIRVDLAKETSAIFDGTEDVTPGVTGVLPAINGGTGLNELARNYVMTGGGNKVVMVRPYTGALFSPTDDAAPYFGLLPVICGGTGASTPEAARAALGITPATIGALPANPENVENPSGVLYLRGKGSVALYPHVNGNIYGVEVKIADASNMYIQPTNSAKDIMTIGNSNRKFKTAYFSDSAIVTSDRNKKTDIHEIDDRFVELFDGLKPVSYKLAGSNHDRDHLGFVAQDVEASMQEIGIDPMEFGGFCRDVEIDPVTGKQIFDLDGNPIHSYALRYGEFIALNSMMIQKNRSEVKALRDELSALRAEVELLKKQNSGL